MFSGRGTATTHVRNTLHTAQAPPGNGWLASWLTIATTAAGQTTSDRRESEAVRRQSAAEVM